MGNSPGELYYTIYVLFRFTIISVIIVWNTNIHKIYVLTI